MYFWIIFYSFLVKSIDFNGKLVFNILIIGVFFVLVCVSVGGRGGEGKLIFLFFLLLIARLAQRRIFLAQEAIMQFHQAGVMLSLIHI